MPRLPNMLVLSALFLFSEFAPPARAEPTPAPAPVPGTGVLGGLVVDPDGLPIPGVTVVVSTPSATARTVITDADGRWEARDLPPGTYTVRASREGFGPMQSSVVVSADRTVRVDLTLTYRSESVVVIASTPEFLSRVPEGRSYQSAVGTSAGVIGRGNPNMGGASRNENVRPTFEPPPPLPPGWVPPSTNQDQYAAIDEHRFVDVGDDPLSTFGIDVDTASYANVRRYLEAGQAPPRDAVRIEELINYFAYAYEPPEGDAPFTTQAEVTEAPWAPGHRLVRIGIQGREVVGRAVPPRNLVFLVDVSGSMSGDDRLPLVKRGLQMLAGELGPADHVALVAYAGTAGVVLPPTRGDRTAEITDAIARLGAGGSTAGAAGIRGAYALAQRNFQAGAVNRVILATDGDFNVGVSSESELLQLIEAERDGGVALTVLGVGRGNLQDAKMELLADHGNGNYAYIDGYAEMEKVLREEVSGTLVTIAKDVKIQVEFNPARVSSYRLLGYENRALAARDFADDTKDAGEIGAGHRVTALYEVVPARPERAARPPALRYQADRPLTEAGASDELLTVHVRYKAPTGDTSSLLSFPVVDRGGGFADASVDTRWAVAVAGYGMLLRDSPDRGALDWSWVRRAARESLGEDPRGYRAELLGLVEKARRLDAVAAE